MFFKFQISVFFVTLPSQPSVFQGVSFSRNPLQICEETKKEDVPWTNDTSSSTHAVITLPPHTISCPLSPPHVNQAVCSC